MDYLFLQHYWWFLVSLLGALLVFLYKEDNPCFSQSEKQNCNKK